MYLTKWFIDKTIDILVAKNKGKGDFIMFCTKCGNHIQENQKFCNKCGNTLIKSHTLPEKTNNKKMIFMGLGVGLTILLIMILCVFTLKKSDNDYYTIEAYENYEEEEEKEDNVKVKPTKKETKSKKNKYKTVIVADNKYFGVQINNNKDAKDLIIKDSVEQKTTTPKEIKDIEDEIIKKYKITAVNLCEMDVEFAKEIENVIGKIYNEYPSVRGNLTNITLINGTMSENYIAAFMPAFNFARADSESTYPWVMKTQVLLNTTFFLNPERLNASVIDGSNSGHFPPNATMYSPVAHEFGHYLSFLALLNNYNLDSILLIDNTNINEVSRIVNDYANGDFSLKMIEEAYENYKNDIGTNLTFDEWRATISSYAVAKDNSGNYIYDETIAEAFHDVYLNEENAQDASKYVVSVLKKYLEG